MSPQRCEFAVILSDHTDTQKWQKHHEEIALRLAEGWQITQSHAGLENGHFVIYTFMTRLTAAVLPVGDGTEKVSVIT